MTTIDEEVLWTDFLMEYLENVKRILPDSFRAKQLKAGGMEKALVYGMETKFMKEPFLKALRKVQEKPKKEQA